MRSSGKSVQGIDQAVASWSRLVDVIVQGSPPAQPQVRIGRTPDLLQGLGLAPADLVMATGKVARCRREHPEVSLSIWHELPRLIGKPLAVVPSQSRDGSMVVVLVVRDVTGDPVLVPIMPGSDGGPNVVLSIYGKEAGFLWLQKQINRAVAENLPHYVGKGFAATLPQPGSVSKDTIPSSPGPIPADGTTKPKRYLLRLREKSTES